MILNISTNTILGISIALFGIILILIGIFTLARKSIANISYYILKKIKNKRKRD